MHHASWAYPFFCLYFSFTGCILLDFSTQWHTDCLSKGDYKPPHSRAILACSYLRKLDRKDSMNYPNYPFGDQHGTTLFRVADRDGFAGSWAAVHYRVLYFVDILYANSLEG